MITLANLGRTTKSYAFRLLIFLNVDRQSYANRVQRNSHPNLHKENVADGRDPHAREVFYPSRTAADREEMRLRRS